MALSRSTRITLLLVIDVIFFLIELIAGYAVGSLALVADSFHMLNDVMSLIVALYAIKLASQDTPDSRYSYGWHRAEVLAALVNGVFLLALCFSITLEALQRFFSTPEISNPRLIVIVGTFGLASNIVGLFLFHEHSHSHDHKTTPSSSTPPSVHRIPPSDVPPTRAIPIKKRTDSFSSLYGHPAATRASVVQTAQDMAYSVGHSSPMHIRHTSSAHAPPSNDHQSDQDLTEDAPLLGNAALDTQFYRSDALITTAVGQNQQPHGHSHAGSMNMHALLLHVLGDALGNVGVISTGLVIWLTDWEFKYFFDPMISLVITVIIFSSALPLVRSASFILLQGVPPTISLDAVRQSILSVDGVLSVHELHIWQLSESKIVASVHVMTSRNHDFMPVAGEIRKVLHYHGIHSSTIQPEYHSPSPDSPSKVSANSSCLIVCPPDQGCDPAQHACCPPPVARV